jgi:hypothetical protein
MRADRHTWRGFTALRWLSTPAAAFAGFFVGLFGCAACLLLLGAAFSISAPGGILDVDVRDGLAGFGAAIATVVAGSTMAPNRRRAVSLLIFAAGTYPAWILVGRWYFPEHHPRAYQSSARPFILTELGGIAGVLLVWFWRPLRTAWPTPARAAHEEAEA